MFKVLFSNDVVNANVWLFNHALNIFLLIVYIGLLFFAAGLIHCVIEDIKEIFIKRYKNNKKVKEKKEYEINYDKYEE